ncbi:hypothetical protein A0H76_1267 [Hepatospora eriocheir]|uniref:ABC transporter domain-containing protein n=1 Tax=Hepatospora eriocheir TaxID=1081669 RepID=A0A1X0QKR7_9MICR|nr:hypothetical protein A0H76_1267 [Hepatospora eriocheir]
MITKDKEVKIELTDLNIYKNKKAVLKNGKGVFLPRQTNLILGKPTTPIKLFTKLLTGNNNITYDGNVLFNKYTFHSNSLIDNSIYFSKNNQDYLDLQLIILIRIFDELTLNKEENDYLQLFEKYDLKALKNVNYSALTDYDKIKFELAKCELLMIPIIFIEMYDFDELEKLMVYFDKLKLTNTNVVIISNNTGLINAVDNLIIICEGYVIYNNPPTFLKEYFPNLNDYSYLLRYTEESSKQLNSNLISRLIEPDVRVLKFKKFREVDKTFFNIIKNNSPFKTNIILGLLFLLTIFILNLSTSNPCSIDLFILLIIFLPFESDIKICKTVFKYNFIQQVFNRKKFLHGYLNFFVFKAIACELLFFTSIGLSFLLNNLKIKKLKFNLISILIVLTYLLKDMLNLKVLKVLNLDYKSYLILDIIFRIMLTVIYFFKNYLKLFLKGIIDNIFYLIICYVFIIVITYLLIN